MSAYRVERADGEIVYESDIAPTIDESDRLHYRGYGYPEVLPGDRLVVTYGTAGPVEMLMSAVSFQEGKP